MMLNPVKHFDHVRPDFNTSIAFISIEDPRKWVIGWMDVTKVREEKGISYDPNRLTLWFELPPTNL